MSDANPSGGELVDFTAATRRTGFRLQWLEMLNWGTFHEKVWSFDLGGDTSLLTGDIGSGKSTVVDAITTLLVAPQRISYNKAAGADARERSVRSYFFGHYKAERSDLGAGAKPVALRSVNDYSVLLANFYNAALRQHVTLAQVFWMRAADGQPDRLCLVADDRLSIAEHFSKVTDIAELRKRMRALTRDVYESFSQYQTAFRKRFGIQNDQALELFNQTVSMKAVGNLTDFVRAHMLQPFPVEQRIQDLITHVDDLTRAHDAVLRAKDQVTILQPIVRDCDQHDALSNRVADARACREALEPWFASQRIHLLDAAIATANEDLQRSNVSLAAERRKKVALDGDRDRIRLDIANNGGDRIEHLKSERSARQRDEKERAERAATYDTAARHAGLDDVVDAQSFHANVQRSEQLRSELNSEIEGLRARAIDAEIRFKSLVEERRQVFDELESLRQRKSNIPLEFLRLRDQLCEGIGVDEEELPFAGELMRVHADELEWEGAIERVLRPFGTSLLVPDAYYAKVSKWVDAKHLGMRLVYHRLKDGVRSRTSTQPNSLSRKLEFDHKSPHADWVENELIQHFNPICCDTLDEFRRERDALTKQGQHKTGFRHVKDDWKRVDDRTRYVLGWANEEKRAALEKLLCDVEERAQQAGEASSHLRAAERERGERRRAIDTVLNCRTFVDIDWRTSEAERLRLDAEIEKLERTSDVLRELQQRLRDLDGLLEQADAELTKLSKEQSRVEARLEQLGKDLGSAKHTVDRAAPDAVARFAQLEALRAEHGELAALTVDNGIAVERALREWLQKRIDADQKKIESLGQNIASSMQKYCERYPTETREVGASLAAAGDYRQMLKTLLEDDLPRFERKFKELLNENTIREVAGFQSQLKKEQHEIAERIEAINRSLKQIEFNPGRYIALVTAPVTDAEVRDFQQELKACTEGTLTGSGDDAYSEAKFIQVKKIIERFRGREGTADADLKWTRKVTDVRNWFSFSASERWLENDVEHEHYSDSSGKSGGQKEKLAYTVLAASLAYQFGLDGSDSATRSFHFAVIDEAFGRGSDESATYALELFRKLNLQLLVVTPLQKIHVIEPFVANVGFVANATGQDSKLRNLSIEEYREEKARRGA